MINIYKKKNRSNTKYNFTDTLTHLFQVDPFQMDSYTMRETRAMIKAVAGRIHDYEARVKSDELMRICQETKPSTICKRKFTGLMITTFDFFTHLSHQRRGPFRKLPGRAFLVLIKQAVVGNQGRHWTWRGVHSWRTPWGGDCMQGERRIPWIRHKINGRHRQQREKATVLQYIRGKVPWTLANGHKVTILLWIYYLNV